MVMVQDPVHQISFAKIKRHVRGVTSVTTQAYSGNKSGSKVMLRFKRQCDAKTFAR